MSCPPITIGDQFPLAACVYIWAWLVLCAWSFQHANKAPGGRAALMIVSFFWPITVLMLARKAAHRGR